MKKKVVSIIVAALLILPLLFMGSASASLAAPTDFEAYGFGKDMSLQWKYSGNINSNLEIEIFEYDFTTLQWKSLGSIPYEPDTTLSNVSYGRHNYKVRAKISGTGGGQTQYSDFSNVDSGYILKAPKGKPNVSINQFTSPAFKGDMAVTIKWSAVTDPFTTHVGIYRKRPGKKDFKMIGMPTKSVTSYKDITIQPNTQYVYLILNMRKDGSKTPDFSPSLTQDGSVLTYPVAPQNFKAVGKGKDLILTWTRVESCDGIKVFEQESALKWSALGTLNKEVYKYTLKSSPYGKHTIQIVSYNTSGNSPNAPIQTAYILKAPHIKAITAISSDEVRIYYSQLDPNAPEITSYYSKNGKIFTLIGATKMNPDSTYVRIIGLMPSTKYYFEIAATRGENVSIVSNVLSVTTPAPNALPKAPTNLKAELTNDGKVLLTWKDNADNETGFKVERKKQNDSSYKVIVTLPTDISETKYTDKTVAPGTTYNYRVVAYNSKGEVPSKTVSITTPSSAAQKVVIQLQPDNEMMVVNGEQKEIDLGRGTKPVIVKEWGRTVVPIRAIVEALGGTIGWDGTERKVTINFNGTTIELWIDNPHAKVNGIAKWIDENNHNVKPIIKNGRTMLPLRFVAENLGCKVDWNAATKTITITHPVP